MQAIHAYFKDIYDVEQRMADARAHMDAVKPKYNNDQKKYSKDQEYQKYHKIMGDILKGHTGVLILLSKGINIIMH